MLHEILRKQITVTKQEETSLSWNNFVLCISGYKNLYLLDFSYNLHSLEKMIDIKECSINASYDSPVPTNYLSNYAAQGIKNMDLMEMITNPAFWPHHKMLTQEMTNIVACRWSPENLISNYKSILATVNSVGNVELFAFYEHVWVSILNFSTEMSKHLSLEFEMLSKCPKTFEEMKDVVYSLETATICWAPELNNDNSCYLVTVQKSGEILIWLLSHENDSLHTQFCNRFKNKNKFEVPFVIWIPQANENFLLIFSNEIGQVIANKFEIVDKNIVLLEEQNVWSHEDKMMVTFLDYIYVKDKLLLVFNKNRHLIVQMYDSTFKLLSQCVKNVNDYKITSITKNNDEFHVCTVNLKMYKIVYNIHNDVLDVTVIPVGIKESYTDSDLFGISFSKNKAICALGLFNRQLLIRKQTFKIDIIFLCNELDTEPNVTAILNNPSKKIADVWDHIEVLRCKVIKSKKLPNLDYKVLLEDGEHDTYKLKLYLVFLTFYQNLERMMTQSLKGLMPETSKKVIKERILFFQSLSNINKIYAKHEKNNCLTDLENECFEYSKRFLDYYCNRYEKRLKDYISEERLGVPCGYIEHECQSCDEVIKDFSCKNKHVNMFCSLTFTPIMEDEYLTCKCCSSTARIQILEQNPTCVFCDVYLNKSI